MVDAPSVTVGTAEAVEGVIFRSCVAEVSWKATYAPVGTVKLVAVYDGREMVVLEPLESVCNVNSV